MTDTEWKLKAACDVTIHGDIWYRPSGVEKHSVRKARIAKATAVCRGCPVLEQCRNNSAGEGEGIWAGIDHDAPPPREPKPRKKRAGKPADSENGRRASASATAAQQRRFDHMVEHMTRLHHDGHAFDDILAELGTSAHALRRRLRRRDRMDLYSMLTGAAA